MANLKLFMLLLGCKPPGRHTEQHDIYFGIAESLKDLIPSILAFWPESGKTHIDAWREVNTVDGYAVKVLPRETGFVSQQKEKLFFINLGGYQQHKFEEQHYVLLTVKDEYAAATKSAKETLFFQQNQFTGANSHIDDKYGIDVDDIYQIEDLLSDTQKAAYQIELTRASNLAEDEINLGYFKLTNL